MASQKDDFGEEENTRKSYQAPYTSHHPIPTVQRYKAERGELDAQQKKAEEAQHDEKDESKVKRAYNSAKAVLKGEDDPKDTHDPYPTANRNVQNGDTGQPHPNQPSQTKSNEPQGKEKADKPAKKDQDEKNNKSASEAAAGHSDPREKRKIMKHSKRDDGGREVTDPVTHLPVVIRDSTNKDLNSAPENEPASGSNSRSKTGLSGASKSDSQLDEEKHELQNDLDGMQRLFPPPNFEDVKAELAKTYRNAITLGLGAITTTLITSFCVTQLVDTKFFSFTDRQHGNLALGQPLLPLLVSLVFASVVGLAILIFVRGWLGKKVETIWKDEVWDAARQEELQTHDSDDNLPESVAWLNSLLASVWPLINPDLFTSIADMLEDVMQASLPKVVRMVSVDDLGQGSEAVRILGVRWLPTGAASRTVDTDGNIKGQSDQESNDRSAANEGEVDQDKAEDDSNETQDESSKGSEDKKQKEQEEEAVREGMEAEQGDFVNMELAFSYRARSSGKSLKTKAKNAHLYLKFYLPGGIAVPVWVEMRGIIGTMRLRLQLTPDPPFFSLCTLTFLGQPRADLSCIPLSKHSLNIMDVPLISSFVQSSIDAALAEYVAPKSLTLDLKDMLVGDDFKKDTVARGVVVVYIKHARGFKEGDGGVGPLQGSSDAYVTVSWGKFGKPMASTRIIAQDQEPNWHEWSQILVGPEELNAGEKLRLQIWDSDKHTADDDLGRVEVDLHELMHNSKSRNTMCDREDRLHGEDPDEAMPGTLTWAVGYFSKTKITSEQLASQSEDKNIRSVEDLKKQVTESAERKLREATAHDESKEIKQQKQEDFKEREDALIKSSPPPTKYPSGVLSIQVHNITGLEVQQLQKRNKDEGDREDEAEHSDDLPSSYVNIILNQQKIYRTRTKPKNAKPFFNAGTERFVRDWQTTEVMISVRDDRERENDALLGIIYLPLRRVFEHRSQVMESYPLAGGIGYGRARISMVWRSMELKLPKELLGWNYGTIEVKGVVRVKSGDIASELQGHRLRLRTNMMKQKMEFKDDDGEPHWAHKSKKDGIFLPVRNRYSSGLMAEFRKSTLGPDSTIAFGTFWLKDVADEEDTTITIKIWKGDKTSHRKATSSCDYQGSKDGEEAIGELELKIRFWRGLSGYHKKWARKGKNTDIQDVMEVLDTANDENEMEDGDDDGQNSDSSDSDESDDSGESSSRRKNSKLKTRINQSGSKSDLEGEDDDNKHSKNPIAKVKDKVEEVLDSHNDADDGSRGVVGQARDYKDHWRQLHRQHRGVMQWKGARTLDWMVSKARSGKGRLGNTFEHGDKGPGIETEA